MHYDTDVCRVHQAPLSSANTPHPTTTAVVTPERRQHHPTSLQHYGTPSQRFDGSPTPSTEPTHSSGHRRIVPPPSPSTTSPYHDKNVSPISTGDTFSALDTLLNKVWEASHINGPHSGRASTYWHLRMGSIVNPSLRTIPPSDFHLVDEESLALLCSALDLPATQNYSSPLSRILRYQQLLEHTDNTLHFLSDQLHQREVESLPPSDQPTAAVDESDIDSVIDFVHGYLEHDITQLYYEDFEDVGKHIEHLRALCKFYNLPYANVGMSVLRQRLDDYWDYIWSLKEAAAGEDIADFTTYAAYLELPPWDAIVEICDGADVAEDLNNFGENNLHDLEGEVEIFNNNWCELGGSVNLDGAIQCDSPTIVDSEGELHTGPKFVEHLARDVTFWEAVLVGLSHSGGVVLKQQTPTAANSTINNNNHHIGAVNILLSTPAPNIFAFLRPPPAPNWQWRSCILRWLTSILRLRRNAIFSGGRKDITMSFDYDLSWWIYFWWENLSTLWRGVGIHF